MNTRTLKTGLLWFDDAPTRTLEAKVLRAATHYHRKHGHHPNLCLVYPSAFNDNGNRPGKKVGDVEIRPRRSVLPHHFWLGVTDEEGGCQ